MYAVQDRGALHVRTADEAVPLGGLTPEESYLDMARLLRAAADSGADALHPGYGYLAENADAHQHCLLLASDMLPLGSRMFVHVAAVQDAGTRLDPTLEDRLNHAQATRSCAGNSADAARHRLTGGRP